MSSRSNVEREPASWRDATMACEPWPAANGGGIDAPVLRDSVLHQHATLRAMMEDLGAESARALLSEANALRPMVSAFRFAFERHLRFEEAALMPVLRQADAWGPLRVARMEEEHVAQRAELTALAAEAAEPSEPTEHLVADVSDFIERLLIDMHEEEEAFLSPAALGEDIVVLDQCGG